MRSICCFAVCLAVICILLFSPAYALPPNPGEKMYTPEQIKNISAEAFLEMMVKQEPGYWQFAAMNALSTKIKESDSAARESMLKLVISVMKDKNRNVYQRWQCCYVISGSGVESGLPDLIDGLLHDPSQLVRSVAAEAVASYKNNSSARDALLQSARTETSPSVRDVLNKRVGAEMPGLEPIPATDIQKQSGQTMLQQVWKAESGRAKFDAIDAAAKTIGGSDLESKRVITAMFVAAMNDKSRSDYQRWPCCYVITRSGEDQGVPDVIDILLGDKSDTMRAVAAEALGGIMQANTKARDALMQAAHTESVQSVRDVMAKYLGKDMPE